MGRLSRRGSGEESEGWGSMFKILFSGLLASGLVIGVANAKVIAHCGVSNGYAFYPKYGIAAKNKDAGEWTKDRISNGQFSISLSDNGKFDVLFKDVSGGIFSTVADGGQIILLGKTTDSLSLFVGYPNKSAETYTVYRTIEGKTEMMWTQNKFGVILPKVAAFIASCRYFKF